MAKTITIEITGKGDQLGRATQQVERDLDKVAKKVETTGSKFSGLGGAAKNGLSGLQGVGSSVVAATSGMEGGFTSLQGVITTTTSSLGPVGIAIGAVVGPLLGGAAALASFSQTAVDYGVQVGKVQRLTGMAADQSSLFAYAAQQTGIDVDALGKALGRFEKGLVTGKVDGFAGALKGQAKDAKEAEQAQNALTKAQQRLADVQRLQASEGPAKTQTEAIRRQMQLRDAQEAVADAQQKVNDAAASAGPDFEKLGFATRDATGALRPMWDILGDVADKFAGMEDGPEKAALAQQLFGKTGADLIPMLNQGREGLAAYKDEAEQYGLVMDDAGIAKARAAKGAQKDLAAAWKGFQVQLGTEVMPVLTELTKWLADHLPQAMEAIRPGIEFLKDAFRQVSDAFKEGGWQGAVDKIVEILGHLWEKIEPVLGPMVDKMVGAIGQWVQDHIPDILAAFAKWQIAVTGWVIQGIGKLLLALGGLLAMAGEWIWNVGLPKLLELFGEWGRAALSWIGDAIAKFPERAGYLVGAVIGWAIGFAAELPGHMLDAGKAVLSWIANAVTEAPGKLAELAGKIWEFATSLPGKVVGWIGDVARTLWDKGTDLVRGLADGIKDAVGRFLQGALSGLIDFIPDWIKDKLGIHSPSTVTMALGRHIGEGLAVGIAGSQGLVESAMGGLSLAASGSLAVGQGTPTRSAIADRFQPAGSTQRIEVPVHLDGQVLTRVVLDHTRREAYAGFG